MDMNLQNEFVKGLDSMAPDIYKRIASEKIKKIESVDDLFGNEEITTNKFKASRMYRFAMVAVLMLIMTATIIHMYMPNGNDASNGRRYIYIDVNPSLRIHINSEGNATEVKALNDDAKSIADAIPDSLSEEKVLESIVDELNKEGYFENNNAILVSVNKELDKDYENIVSGLEKYVGDSNLNVRIIVRRISSDDKVADDISKKYAISYGKAHFIEEICDKKKDINVEEIAKLNITEILEKINGQIDLTNNITEKNQDEIIKNKSELVNSKEVILSEHKLNNTNINDTEKKDDVNEIEKINNNVINNKTINNSAKNNEIDEKDAEISENATISGDDGISSVDDDGTSIKGDENTAESDAVNNNDTVGGYIDTGLVVVPLSQSEKEEYIEDNGLSQASGIPENYDSREKNIVTQVKNQDKYGSMGTCWTFSTMAVSETFLAYQLGYDMKSLDLSEMQLLYFAYHRVPDPIGGTCGDYNSAGNNDYRKLGGNYNLSVTALASWMGPINEAELPYENVKNSSLELGDVYAYEKTVAHLQNSRWISMTETDIVKAMIMDVGAVQVSYKHSNAYYDAVIGSYYNNLKSGTMHAVTIVGWDDNYSKENFKVTPENDGAWLVKNSWGTLSGDVGYFWLSYEDAYTQTQAAYTYEYEGAQNYDNNYQYDGCADLGRTVSYGGRESYMANVFTANDNETLEAVSFYLMDVNMDYEIQVYKDIEGVDNPTNGTPQFDMAQEGSEVLQGYYTVNLDKKVELSAGEKYSVVIRLLTDEGSTAMIPVENSENVGYITTAYSEAGQSYTSGSGIIWTDRKNNGNVRIKAFTVNKVKKEESTTQEPTEEITTEEETTTIEKPEEITTEEETTTIEKPEEITTEEETTTIEKPEEPTREEETTEEIESKPAKAKLKISESKLNIVVGGTDAIKVIDIKTGLLANVKWKSSNNTIVKVDSTGEIKGVKSGTAIIAATSKEGQKLKCKVTVLKAPNKITLNKTKVILKKGKKVNLKYTITKNTFTKVKYTTSNKKVATVSSVGKVKAVGKGTATIKVKTANGKKATCKVVVK